MFPPLGPLVAVLGGSLWIIRWLIRRWPKPETLTWFEDLSVEGRQNPDSNRVLTSFVLSHLQNNRSLQMSELHMDIMPGANEPGFGGLRPAQEANSIPGFVTADHPIKIGSVEFSPGDALGYFRRWFDRPNKQYLLGWLLASDTEATAVARLVDNAKKTKRHIARKCVWRSHTVGSNARSQAIADLSAQIVVDMGKSKITTNWQSFRSFHDGMNRLQLDQTWILEPANITEARRSFEDALTYDASNWMARFQLALLLCKENEPRAALEHLAILESILKCALEQKAAGWTSDPKESYPKWSRMRPKQAEDTCAEGSPAFKRLLRHLHDYPECPFLVLYNKAIALSSLPDSEHKREAVELLEQLSRVKDDPDIVPEFKKCAERLSDRSYIELKLYSLSSQAHILASVQASHSIRSSWSADRLKQINEKLCHIEDLCLQRQQEHWGSLQTARAVAHGAAARVLAEEGHVNDASKHLHEALAAEPKFVGAYLQLAELYIREKEKLVPRWDLLAESQLRHAAEINPKCQETQLILAALYCEPLIGRIVEADCILQKLHDVPEANLLLIKNALDNSKSDCQVLEPLRRLCRQIRLRAGSGEQAVQKLKQLQSESCLTLVQSNSQFCQLLDSLRTILRENLSQVQEEKRLLEAIQHCGVPANFAAAV